MRVSNRFDSDMAQLCRCRIYMCVSRGGGGRYWESGPTEKLHHILASQRNPLFLPTCIKFYIDVLHPTLFYDGMSILYFKILSRLTPQKNCFEIASFFLKLKLVLPNVCHYYPIDVPRPLTNDLWVFLFQTIDAECVK